MTNPSSSHPASGPDESASRPLEQLTADQQIVNCLLALWRWGDVQPEQVAAELNFWRCGSQACFGGHLLMWPEFLAQGIVPRKSNDGVSGRAPSLAGDTNKHRFSHNASAHLFGNDVMFYCRTFRNEQGTDHEVVVNRLEQRIAELSEAA